MSNKELKAKAKLYIDANVHDGEDRTGCDDLLVFTPDELQELVDEVIEGVILEIDLNECAYCGNPMRFLGKDKTGDRYICDECPITPMRDGWHIK